MGLSQLLAGRRIYLDSNVWIYAFEAESNFAGELQRLFEAIPRGELNAVASELVLAEILVRPLREGRLAHAETYQRYMRTQAHFDVLPVTRPILLEAAYLRAASALKLPDAIHAATARYTRCEVFLTNDDRIKSIPDIDVVQLSTTLE